MQIQIADQNLNVRLDPTAPANTIVVRDVGMMTRVLTRMAGESPGTFGGTAKNGTVPAPLKRRYRRRIANTRDICGIAPDTIVDSWGRHSRKLNRDERAVLAARIGRSGPRQSVQAVVRNQHRTYWSVVQLSETGLRKMGFKPTTKYSSAHRAETDK